MISKEQEVAETYLLQLKMLITRNSRRFRENNKVYLKIYIIRGYDE